MKTSARNQFYGEVVLLKKGTVNAEIVLRIDGGEYVAAVITNKSLQELGLKEGNKAWALVKASSVILVAADEQIKTSARNQFFGRITELVEGAVNCEVTLESEGDNRITAVVTNESMTKLGLKQGMSMYALAKASSVLIAVDD